MLCSLWLLFFAQFCKNFGTFFAEEREIFRNDNVVMIINIWKEWKRRSFKWEIFLQERRRRRRRELRRQWHRRSSREQQIRSKSCCVRKILVEQKKHFYQTNKFLWSETRSDKRQKKVTAQPGRQKKSPFVKTYLKFVGSDLTKSESGKLRGPLLFSQLAFFIGSFWCFTNARAHWSDGDELWKIKMTAVKIKRPLWREKPSRMKTVSLLS